MVKSIITTATAIRILVVGAVASIVGLLISGSVAGRGDIGGVVEDVEVVEENEMGEGDVEFEFRLSNCGIDFVCVVEIVVSGVSRRFGGVLTCVLNPELAILILSAVGPNFLGTVQALRVSSV